VQPSNPTGTTVRKLDLDRFLDAVPADVVVVLDEAYRELVDDPQVPNGLQAYGDRPNVVVLHTLSKAWGLTGLRLGHLMAGKVVTPFLSSLLAGGSARSAPREGGDEPKVRADHCGT
jgi:histidinol-phosphate aminotransferase